MHRCSGAAEMSRSHIGSGNAACHSTRCAGRVPSCREMSTMRASRTANQGNHRVHAAAADVKRLHSCTQAEEPDEINEAEQLDVTGVFVNTAFRSTPSDVTPDDSKARVVFVSESNVCRSILAEATMTRLLEERGLDAAVQCASRATRDYCVNEPPEAVVLEVAAEQDLLRFIPEGHVATQFDFSKDIVQYDLVLVMDKFTAADVLREVSVYDTIDKEGSYSGKVRHLGEFHPRLAANTMADGQDIDDPLYGNVGGAAEKAEVESALTIISEACEGLVTYLEGLAGSPDNGSLALSLRKAVLEMKTIQWLVPPMLQTK